ncbi:phage major capsid protein [Jeotgalibacillus sp. S-D1]|uniref:phage major capsid protein n=1 Tax=Jeotgalibacillus sp. S-D1 TaxID=2552189 RepID=UPI001059F53B|nr:phage major capsid protein [Jeotgalibacillus sp. S-D1]TDL34572.1 phage major capsid protein [Jeotgalibacillus sp. S-D1]
MALKQLMLAKKIDQRKSSLAELITNEEGLNKRSSDLESSIEEAQTEEEVKVVEEEIEKLEGEKSEHDEKKSALEDELSKLEEELDQLNAQAPENKTERSIKKENKTNTNKGESRMKVNKFETRSEMVERLNLEEVRDFYGKVREAVTNKRSLTGEGLLIPDAVMDKIQPFIGDYSNLYKEVEVMKLNGTARAIVDGAIPEAIWTEMTGAVQELSLAFQGVELDGYKVGGFVPIPNSILEDSMIDLANFVEDRIARAIAKAIDKAILTGTGSAGKQPEGVIPAVSVNASTSDFTLKSLLSAVGKVDTGEDAVGEVIAVMKRATYYAHVLPQTVVNTSDGRQVVQGVDNPNIAGVRVVFSQYVPADAVVFGDFKQYMLGERRGVQLASSTDVKFIEDQTVFKGTARYDGKPAKAEAFALVNYQAAPAGA